MTITENYEDWPSRICRWNSINSVFLKDETRHAIDSSFTPGSLLMDNLHEFRLKLCFRRCSSKEYLRKFLKYTLVIISRVENLLKQKSYQTLRWNLTRRVASFSQRSLWQCSSRHTISILSTRTRLKSSPFIQSNLVTKTLERALPQRNHREVPLIEIPLKIPPLQRIFVTKKLIQRLFAITDLVTSSLRYNLHNNEHP